MDAEPARVGTRAHVAVLLAAGGSTRLGQPKQLLTRDGEPLVRRMARLLSHTSPRRLYVIVGAHYDTFGAQPVPVAMT